MPFDPKSQKKQKKIQKRTCKKEGPSIKEKMEMRYEKVLDDLLINRDKLTKIERVNLSNYIFSKIKPARDKFTLEKLKEKKEDFFNQDPQIQPNKF
jgi:hypothetical protein